MLAMHPAQYKAYSYDSLLGERNRTLRAQGKSEAELGKEVPHREENLEMLEDKLFILISAKVSP